MDMMKRFLKEKGLYFALLACIAAAAVACFLAIRDVMSQLNPAKPQPKIEIREEDLWNRSSQTVTSEVGDLPAPARTPAPAADSQRQSAASSGSGMSSAALPEEQPSAEEQEPLPEQGDSLIWPVDGSILQGYSGDELVYNPTLKDWRTHNGVDLAAAQGCRVVAIEDGTVTAVYNDALWGTVLEQTCGERVWRYCGLEAEPAVDAGDSLQAGDTLGRLLTSDCETEAESHLHLELLVNGKLSDPAEALQ